MQAEPPEPPIDDGTEDVAYASGGQKSPDIKGPGCAHTSQQYLRRKWNDCRCEKGT